MFKRHVVLLNALLGIFVVLAHPTPAQAQFRVGVAVGPAYPYPYAYAPSPYVCDPYVNAYVMVPVITRITATVMAIPTFLLATGVIRIAFITDTAVGMDIGAVMAMEGRDIGMAG